MALQRNWICKPQGSPGIVSRLSSELGIDPSLANLLAQRGITTFDEARKWFRPSLDDLHDPFLMKDMDNAVERLVKAADTGEKILVYGDYDVDGTTAVSLVTLFLQPRYPGVDFYIPDRYSEGYGLSMRGVQHAADNGYGLMLTLDCGIKAHRQVERAAQLGVDVIVCDHHEPGDTLPPAVAVLDAKRADCGYPFRELSGCGVAFKLLQAFCIRKGIPPEELYAFIDLVAVSIASDIVEITGENRVLAYYGIKKIEENPLVGLRAIKDVAKMSGPITVSDIVFKIGPRINAAGRIEQGSMAVELLTCTDFARAMEMVGGVNECNETRKHLDKQITEEALADIAKDSSHAGRKTNVVYRPDWHKGVVGIVASRITEVYYRPTVVLTLSNGKITGSARSVDGFDLHAAIEKCAPLLENFGGHKYAAGLGMKPENLQAFRDMFEEAVSQAITPDMLVPKVKIDVELDPVSINAKFFRILKQFEPFGPGNMSPVFCMRGLRDTGSSRTVGDGSHLKINVVAPGNHYYDGIGFGMGHKLEMLGRGPVDICFSLEENSFNGNTSLQMMVRDIKATGVNDE